MTKLINTTNIILLGNDIVFQRLYSSLWKLDVIENNIVDWLKGDMLIFFPKQYMLNVKKLPLDILGVNGEMKFIQGLVVYGHGQSHILVFES